MQISGNQQKFLEELQVFKGYIIGKIKAQVTKEVINGHCSQCCRRSKQKMLQCIYDMERWKDLEDPGKAGGSYQAGCCEEEL